MDTAWIQVFVLTLSECVAPPGKTVCQERELQYEFADRQQCEAVLAELLELKSMAETVIVDTRRSRCVPSIREKTVYASADQAGEALAAAGEPETLPARPRTEQPSAPLTASEHRKRLESLPECSEANRVTPCKVGEIIVESEEDNTIEVWRRDN